MKKAISEAVQPLADRIEAIEKAGEHLSKLKNRVLNKFKNQSGQGCFNG